MMRIGLFVIFVFFALNIAYTQSGDKPLILSLDIEKTYQKIHSFGASDSWRCQFVGKHWPLEKRQKIADLLFSMEVDADGNPKGIGLSNWRFYLGACSMEQGEGSDIGNPWRRSECFLNEDGLSYNWDKYEGQKWFIHEAKRQGVPVLTAYTISPPVYYTKNGLAHASPGDRGFNLKPDYYSKYANYLADVISHFDKQEQIHFNYISPFNEPQWAWDKSNQEGTPARNKELSKYMKLLSTELHIRGLKTKMLVGEAGQLDYLYENKDTNQIGNQIHAFYHPDSEMYIGNLPNLEYAITSHSYFTTWPIEKQIESRQKVAEKIQEVDPDLEYHQTEFCILEKNEEIEGGWKRDLDMPTALYVARVIHSDLTIANASSWEWWTALSQFDFKDGLIHLDDGTSAGVTTDTSELNTQLMYDGHVTETKLLWAMGNFSRFVRPGMVRIDAKLNNNLSLVEAAKDLQVAAFKDADIKEVAIVFINHKEESKHIKIQGINSSRATLYTTDSKSNLKKREVNSKTLDIPARSVCTLVVEGS